MGLISPGGENLLDFLELRQFLSPFLWRAPHLEMRREHREFLPDHAGKGSLLSSYEAETRLLWMWAGLS